MNNVIYILRKKRMDDIEKQLIQHCNLKLCFKNKRERIFKNDEVLITCKKKYISVLVYDDSNESKAHSIVNLIS